MYSNYKGLPLDNGKGLKANGKGLPPDNCDKGFKSTDGSNCWSEGGLGEVGDGEVSTIDRIVTFCSISSK